jgi:hypothetical protein
MARIKPIDQSELSPSVQVAFERHVEESHPTGVKTLMNDGLAALEGLTQKK